MALCGLTTTGSSHCLAQLPASQVAGLGIAITWFGYSVMYYGITQIRGGNWGLLDLIVPGRWTAATAGIPTDSGKSNAAQTTAPNPATTSKPVATKPAPLPNIPIGGAFH